jgi:hypothetical protein
LYIGIYVSAFPHYRITKAMGFDPPQDYRLCSREWQRRLWWPCGWLEVSMHQRFLFLSSEKWPLVEAQALHHEYVWP